MKWVLSILLILTLCAVVAGLAVLASLGSAAPRARNVERPAEVATVQRATITLRPTRTAQPPRTATAAAPAAPAAPAVTASATALPPTAGPIPRPRTATALAQRATASAAPTEAATSLPEITATLSVSATIAITDTAVAPSGAITATATISPSLAVTATGTITGTAVAPSGAITTTETISPAASITATLTVTPGETITATVAAQAATPGATPSPYPLRPNWTDHPADGFRVALPERWNAVDVTMEGAGGIQDRLVELSGAWIESQREIYSAESLPQGLQLWAMDSRAVGGSHATLTVVMRELTQTMTLRELVPQISAELRASRMQILGTRYGLTTNGLDTARMVVRGRVGPATTQQYVYVYLRDNRAWIATYTVDWRYWGSFYPTFAASASSFRAD